MKSFMTIIFSSLILTTGSSWAMKLTSTVRNFELVETKSKTWISKSCKKCEAESIYQTLTKNEAKTALDKDQRGQVPIGTRLCSGLGGSVWLLMDEKKVQVAVCEFKDKSATLTSDLSALAHRLLE